MEAGCSKRQDSDSQAVTNRFAQDIRGSGAVDDYFGLAEKENVIDTKVGVVRPPEKT